MNLNPFKNVSPIKWANKFLDATDPTASLRHLAYALGVGASIVWLSVDMAIKEAGTHRGIDANWVAAYGIFIGVIAITKMKGPDAKGTGSEQAQGASNETPGGDA